ncbi:MAG: hypothetical protein HY599_00565 [Candidatus Omnitrophica bacterium]|nr:hypothetical protein [Candidatus Omnitrophota bacterium]
MMVRGLPLPCLLCTALLAVFIPHASAQPQTLRGEIVDPAAYLKTGEHGPEREELTYEAVDGGQTLALLEERTNALYLFLAEEPGEDPNELAYDYVNRQVTVVGQVFERSGLKGIIVSSIAPAAADPTPPSAAAPAPAN